ncbi:DUF2157 domain-containing protein [Microbulbifer marinus]|uniref:Uncharacterized membrane protein n=1 Tax=Microbulbifer marinus TaxID=658218 RepID=A0A1H3VS29_9GAMM|nr:DUF2157 domain-containing protein [Microbulbifer marinus]SDZ77576.1 Uncharacterized membrane protein [Microbulbifer marinus]
MRLIRLLKNDLAREAGEWVEEGVISEPQAELICGRYGVDYHQAKNRSFGYNVLVGLGYLFIGLAIITLLGANWDEIPRALRMWGLIAITLTTQGFALQHYRAGDYSAGVGLFLLGNLFFGASIILIAQIYHLGEHMPDGVFWWALGCLPFALLTKNPWLALQANLLAAIWFFMQISYGFYPALFPLFILASVYVLRHGRQSIVLLLVVLGSIGFWVEYSLAALWRDADQFFLFDLHAENLAVAVALFILLFAFSQWLRLRPASDAKDYAAVISVWCLRFTLITLLVLSFAAPWRQLLEADWNHLLSMWLVIVLLSAAALWLATRAGGRLSSALLLGAFAVVLLAVTVSGDPEHAIFFQVVTNFALIGSGVWLIVRGIQGGISHYFFLGVASILVTALLRYFDLIGDYVGGALIFTLFAVLLLGAARYWKRHQAKEGAA